LKKADAILNKSPHQNQLVLQTLYVYADAAHDYRSANEAIDKMLLEKDDGTDTFGAHRAALLKLCEITALKDNNFDRVKTCAAQIDHAHFNDAPGLEPLSFIAAAQLRTLSMATASVPNKPPIQAPMEIGSLDENRMRCRGSLSFITNTDTNIRACTTLIESGQETEKELARDFRDRGVHYNYKHDYDHEIESYDEAIRINPNYAEVFRLRGDAYRLKGDADRAIESYSAALSVEPIIQPIKLEGLL
jgi:tetratricopeptide (TPR) repeat protein